MRASRAAAMKVIEAQKQTSDLAEIRQSLARIEAALGIGGGDKPAKSKKDKAADKAEASAETAAETTAADAGTAETAAVDQEKAA